MKFKNLTKILTPLPLYKAIQRFSSVSIVIPSSIPEYSVFSRSNTILLLAEMNYVHELYST